jgi:hypothetical protein
MFCAVIGRRRERCTKAAALDYAESVDVEVAT